MSIISRCQGQWPYILSTLGINYSYLKNKHGPCPVCGGKDRFRFDDKEKRGTFYCSKCGAGDGIKLLKLFHGWSFKRVYDELIKLLNIPFNYHTLSHNQNNVQNAISCAQDQLENIKRTNSLKRMWQEAQLVTSNDPVDNYLKSRGIMLNSCPEILRYHPRLAYYNEKNFIRYFPAMIACVTNQENMMVTLHRTYLNNGYKANVDTPKKLMPTIKYIPVQSCTIKLYAPLNGELGLAEGIESALSLYVATHIPVWATINAGGLENVILPPHVKKIIIAIDNDKSGRGQEAANKLARRLLEEGRTVKKVMPTIQGQDFNDLLLEKKP